MKPAEAGVTSCTDCLCKIWRQNQSNGGDLEVASHPGQSSHENTILPNLDVVKVIKVIIGSKSQDHKIEGDCHLAVERESLAARLIGRVHLQSDTIEEVPALDASASNVHG